METDQVLDVDELNVVVDCVLSEVYAEVLKERIEKTATSILTCGRPDQPVSLVLKHGHEKKFWICFHWFYGIPFCSPDLVLNSRVQHLELSVGDFGCLVLCEQEVRQYLYDYPQGWIPDQRLVCGSWLEFSCFVKEKTNYIYIYNI